ncbi:nucleotidyl transferase AbiEii/AbiGii toxin family protein [Candidatus Roizmanbacteria bacterium]|nr:nucleotidyl transferase AbiEii/AbiGii toxin family protein [Candidatus Roizmanbacteria bacterium]
MHKNILNADQEQLLSFIKSFLPDFYLVGGTAIALYLGHRRSIDFDLFTDNTFDPMKIRNKILIDKTIEYTFSQGSGELTVLIDKVRVTFFHYPFKIQRNITFEQTLKLPDLITLGAMKAFALGRRAKWKDYVDLYFIFQNHSFQELISKTNSIFKEEFNEKLFRTQLGYFEDVDYTEQIEYITGYEKKDSDIKQFLEKISLS